MGEVLRTLERAGLISGSEGAWTVPDGDRLRHFLDLLQLDSRPGTRTSRPVSSTRRTCSFSSSNEAPTRSASSASAYASPVPSAPVASSARRPSFAK